MRGVSPTIAERTTSRVAVLGNVCIALSLLMGAASLFDGLVRGHASEFYRPSTGISLLVLGLCLRFIREARQQSAAHGASVLACAAALFTLGADVAAWSLGVGATGLPWVSTSMLVSSILGLRAAVLVRQASE